MESQPLPTQSNGGSCQKYPIELGSRMLTPSPIADRRIGTNRGLSQACGTVIVRVPDNMAHGMWLSGAYCSVSSMASGMRPMRDRACALV